MKNARTLVLVLTVALVASSAWAQTTWRLGHIRDVNHPTHAGALRFAELVEEKTEGRITVEVYSDSQLGGIQEMFVQMQTGDLAMVYGGINTLAFIAGGEAFEITAIPFLYRDYEHMRSALKSDFFAPVFEAAEAATGIHVINVAGDTAPRGLSANKPIYGPADFERLKIRTAASEVVLRAMQTLGALPQQVPFADLYVALRTGVVDAQENGAITVVNASLYEVQPYYMVTDYIRDIETFYVDPELWNALSEADRQAIVEASEEAGALVTERTAQQLAEALEFLEANITVIREPELDLPAIRAALEDTYLDWDGTKWPAGLLEAIRGL
ncbi:MAG TPA: TRAP transporter substrate-binding protein [Pseudomonadales bacterium]|nr:TRAP transporter substrate-binding protein [Pseudomonadales bacterium]